MERIKNLVQCTMAEWLANGPSLVREGVVLVILTDKEMYEATSSTGTEYSWSWPREGFPEEKDEITWNLLDMLPRGTVVEGDIWVRRDYPSREDALADLSHACIAWAKVEAESTGEPQ